MAKRCMWLALFDYLRWLVLCRCWPTELRQCGSLREFVWVTRPQCLVTSC